MSALAQYLRWYGCTVSGSDRSLNDPDTAELRRHLERMECSLRAQDGTGLRPDTDLVVVSTAIESDNPDTAAAAARSLPVAHRSDVLAALVAAHRTIAIAGTSGKSTVTGLVFDCLDGCGMSPSVISGAALTSVAARGAYGNAWRGASDLLVVEADESDGTLVKYHPYLGVLLNVSLDHKSVDETTGMLRTLAEQSERVVVNADDDRCGEIPHQVSFGVLHGDWRPDTVTGVVPDVRFVRSGVEFRCAMPGRHNLSNALAACAVSADLGCEPHAIAAALASAGSIARRFQVLPSRRGVTVIDDYAHNPAKIEAALRTAQQLSPRVFAVFQLHGFGPARFMRRELSELFARAPRGADHVLLLPIYYAGGTVQRDISAADIAADCGQCDHAITAPADRSAALNNLATHANPGDLVLIMGARDPSRPAFAQAVADTLT